VEPRNDLQRAHGVVVGGCRLIEQIGSGGTGTVYRATQLGVNRPVAVKLISVLPNDVETIRRFEREAEAAGRLDHPHCLPIYAAGEETRMLYLVMRLVNGPDLSQLIRDEGPLTPSHAVDLIEQVASAVDHAHEVGMVHRDLKPANILVERTPAGEFAYVSDFGLMRALADSHAITLAGQWAGTPGFAAPEQERGETVGPAADVYALARVLARAVGSRPPSELKPVLAKAMATDPADRYRTAGAFAAAARAAISSPTDQATRLNLTAIKDQPTTNGHRSAGLIGAAVAVVLVAAVIAAALLAPKTHQTNTLTTASFATTLPAGWVTVARQQPLQGYNRTIAQSPSADTAVYIDQIPNTTQSLVAHARSVELATAKTTGYQLNRTSSTTIDGSPAIVWSFSLAGQPVGQRVDIFRRIGPSLYAVLGLSSSIDQSRKVATSVADALKDR